MEVVIPCRSDQLLRSLCLHLFFKWMPCLIIKKTVRITGPGYSLHYALIVWYILIVLFLFFKIGLTIEMMMLIRYRSWRRKYSFIGADAAWTRRARSYLIWILDIQKILASCRSISCKCSENAFKTVSQLSNGCCPFLFADRISNFHYFSSVISYLLFIVNRKWNLILNRSF